MKTKKWPFLLGAVFTVLSFSACQDWGEMDPPAGKQTYPKLERIFNLTFDEGENAPLYMLLAYPDGAVPDIVEDTELTLETQKVIHFNKGYMQLQNPMTTTSVQEGISMTFFIKQTGPTEEQLNGGEGVEPYEQDITSALISFETEDGKQRFTITNNGGLNYNAVDGEFSINLAEEVQTGLLEQPGIWHKVAIAIHNNGYFIYVDGKKRINETITAFQMNKIVRFMTHASHLYIGYDGGTHENAEWYVDNLTLYKNIITEKEWSYKPAGQQGGDDTEGSTPVRPVYFNNFEGENSDCTIIGDGKFEDVGGKFGTVFKNAVGGIRTNYLLLPDNLISRSIGNGVMSIAMWVNKGDETNPQNYMWSPLFTAYAAAPNPTNTHPMFACLYRGTLQVNCNGWSDYTDAQNINGANTLYHDQMDWLADEEWHLYVATLTANTAKVYFDGELKNEWVLDGVNNTAAGLFTDGGQLTYLALGGNQAWDWGDPDPGFWFDDFAIYDQELTPAHMKAIITDKDRVYYNDFEEGVKDAEIKGNGEIMNCGNPSFNKVFANPNTTDLRSHYLLLPEDVLAHSAETQGLTISVWVNQGNESDPNDYPWSPLFTAYGAAPNPTNTFPMLACQYRGILQINCNGYTDFTDDYHEQGAAKLYHLADDWLQDKAWHHYAATFTPTTGTVYIDGEIANRWRMDGTSDGQVISGLFTNGADLKYICLGGNQAWNWGDPDPGFFFDNIAIYNRELSQEEIKNIVKLKQ